MTITMILVTIIMIILIISMITRIIVIITTQQYIAMTSSHTNSTSNNSYRPLMIIVIMITTITITTLTVTIKGLRRSLFITLAGLFCVILFPLAYVIIRARRAVRHPRTLLCFIVI